jgi:cytochrome c oxidase accessory protein FixG
MFELPKDRLSTTDEAGRRIYLYPAEVKGKYRDRRSWAHGLLIVVFLLLPWVHWNGRQLLLLDVARREFSFFGLHLRAHDAPLLLFLLLAFTFLIGLITALWGRVWCGWACPQTVFIDFLFRRIETWIEGKHRTRRALDEGPWDGNKILRKSLKYGAFLLVSLVITHSFLAYFVGSKAVFEMVSSTPSKNWTSFLVIVSTTGLILFDFGWFREQFCTIVCPYGRFQSVLIDENSVIVGYDTNRGEPRRGLREEGQGDCVACNRCVQVCPTGIDIRRGLQMECISCTACIDACDEVMEKIKKPAGLIRYTSLAELAGKPKNRFSPRPYVYSALLLACVASLVVALGRKEFLDVTVLRASDSPYQIVSEGSERLVVNHFRLDISNQTGSPVRIFAELGPDTKAALVMPLNPIALGEGGTARADFFLKLPAALVQGRKTIPMTLRYEGGTKNLEVTLVGPGT